MRTAFHLAALAAVAAALCAGPAAAQSRSAVAELKPLGANGAAGRVVFEAQGDLVAVHALLSGLTPSAQLGFHVHEKGDCASPDGASAGGHFNPAQQPHGPQEAAHHAGDMPMLKSDPQGRAEARFTMAGVGLGGGAADLVGRAVIVHAQADDYKTQPTGNSGARIACGVITLR
jgi:superoxide dismutase, Cu-Zn family